MDLTDLTLKRTPPISSYPLTRSPASHLAGLPNLPNTPSQMGRLLSSPFDYIIKIYMSQERESLPHIGEPPSQPKGMAKSQSVQQLGKAANLQSPTNFFSNRLATGSLVAKPVSFQHLNKSSSEWTCCPQHILGWFLLDHISQHSPQFSYVMVVLEGREIPKSMPKESFDCRSAWIITPRCKS